MGALVGAGVALLMAPASGSKSRKLISRKLREWGETAHDGIDHVRDEVSRRVDDLKSHADSAMESGREAVEEAADSVRSRSRRHE